ncbi:hypothetical protein AJ78_03794 [Emergomyces pasteurianus Ep9510]|uniref:Uncharacterized protein n=1 Tax=Emergomyces pasteurianus Ep9510 TaxID=1447872 RepID=A0A1J9PJC1_9EURO|nr:hypothetical protein AJ78_03794 [Emergomyces pasteurianus Ep9510]
MRTSLRHKKRSCLADRLKKFTQLSLRRHKVPTFRCNPTRRRTISSEYLDSPYTPGVSIHIVQLASSSVTTASIQKSESVLAKLKRHVRPLIWWKSSDARNNLGDEITLAQKSYGVNENSQTLAPNEEPKRPRTCFSFFRKFRQSCQTESTPKVSTTSTSVGSLQPPSYHQSTHSRMPASITISSQIRPPTTRNTTFSGATTAEMEPADWPPLTAFPNNRLSGAHQIAAWQISPPPVRSPTRHSDGAHNIQYGESQLTPLEGQYKRNQRADCPVTNWLDGLPDEPPGIRRIAGVENLREVQTSHTI